MHAIVLRPPTVALLAKNATAAKALAGVVLLTAMTLGCGDRRVDDAELGALVLASPSVADTVDAERASSDMGEFRKALATRHSAFSASVGAHRVTATSSIRVESGGAIISELSDTTTIDIDADGNYIAAADNSKDYGRHAIYVGGLLYLRPRFGKYHKRVPNNEGEPEAIRDEMFSTTGAYFELLYAGTEITPSDKTVVVGRDGIEVSLKKATAPAERDPERLAHKKWRDTISVDDVRGRVVLDRETGGPLLAEIEGKVTYVKESKRYAMSLKVAHTFESTETAVAAPEDSATVSAPTLRSEAAEQRKLLEGLSPVGSE